jgi:hypothetical protein
MKVVRENINEKFTEDSDPVEDMNIGMKVKLKKFAEQVSIDPDDIPDELNNLFVKAAERKRIDILEYLLSIGVDINVKNTTYKATALTVAADTKDCSDVLKFLIDHGADVNSRDTFNNTPIIMATYIKDYESMEILLQAGADAYLKDDDNKSAINYAGVHNDIKAINILKKYGYEVS